MVRPAGLMVGRLVARAWSLLSCCFLRQETLLHVLLQMSTRDHNAGGGACGGLASHPGGDQ